jgi:hypothetical protein
MKQKFSILVLTAVLIGLFACTEKEPPLNTLSKKEIKEGWQLLFDGKTTNGWRGYNMDKFPESGWAVKDGVLFCEESDRGEAGSGGDIITGKKFSNFELKLEWKIAKAGNSGILYLVTELPGQAMWHGAPEMQILDDENFPMELHPEQLAGAAYDLVAPNPQNVKPYSEWNQIRIIVNHGKVEHWQNGEKVAAYTLWTPEWKEMVMKSKFSDYPEFLNMSKDGYIGLQDHGGGAWFRNIKIKEL